METIRYDVLAAIRFNAEAEHGFDVHYPPHIFAAFSEPVVLPPFESPSC